MKLGPVSQCYYPGCQTTGGCVGVCSKPAPWEGIREIVELRGSHSEEYEEGFWAGLQAYEDKLKEQDWHGQWQWQCGYERGWDKAMERKREWVGLTDDEIWECFTLDYVDFARAIEAKLKEKNT